MNRRELEATISDYVWGETPDVGSGSASELAMNKLLEGNIELLYIEEHISRTVAELAEFLADKE